MNNTEPGFGLSVKLPVYNIEIEQTVLGCLMLDSSAIERVESELKPEIFYTSGHRLICNAILDLYTNQLPTDLLSVTDYFQSRNTLKLIGGRIALARCLDAAVSTVNIDAFIGILVDKFTRRRLIETASQISDLAYDGEIDVAEILEQTESKVLDLTLIKKTSNFANLAEVAAANYKKSCDVAAGLIPPGIATGYYDLDKITSGLQRSDLIIIAGRPAMGKTSLAINISEHIAGSLNLPVVFFSYEMSKEQLMMRMQCSYSRISSEYARTGKIPDYLWAKYAESMDVIPKYNLHIDDNSKNTTTDIRAICRQLKTQIGQLGLIVIDYIGLIPPVGRDSGNPTIEVTKITKALKGIAKELDVPIIALCQLNRGVESQVNKRPSLSHLRDSGSTEQDSDIVMLLYRDEYYNSESNDRGVAEVIVAKHRNGPLGTVKLLFDAEFTQFKNMAHSYSHG